MEAEEEAADVGNRRRRLGREGAAALYDLAVPRPAPDAHAVDWYLAAAARLAGELRALLRQPGYPHQLIFSPNPPNEEHFLADEFPDAKLNIPIGTPRRGVYLKWLFFGPSCIEPAVIDRAAPRKVKRSAPTKTNAPPRVSQLETRREQWKWR